MTNDEVPTPADRLAELEQKNQRLREENARLRGRRSWISRLDIWAASLGIRVLVGRNLRKSLHAWVAAKSPHDPLPTSETVELVLALLGRIIRVRWAPLLVGVIIGLGPISLLWWQNVLTQEQNSMLQSQTAVLRSQVEQQWEDSFSVRRAQLLQAIDDVNLGSLSRREAVRAFIELENSKSREVVLAGADLSGVDFYVEFDFTCSVLDSVNFNNTTFINASFGGAYFDQALFIDSILSGSNMEGVSLREADFQRANLSNVDLSGSILIGADLTDAVLEETNLTDAKLYSADLGFAVGLTQEQIDVARGDSCTTLPRALKHPSHWEKSCDDHLGAILGGGPHCR